MISLLLVAIVTIPGGLPCAEEPTPEPQSGEAVSITLIVDGMLKSRSGAT